MYTTRTRLRKLLAALIAEREDSQLLYIPHGESGMRRMIAALLVMRPFVENDPLAEHVRRGADARGAGDDRGRKKRAAGRV